MKRGRWRRDPLAALGSGVWRRSYGRLRRAVDRYHQMIEPVDDLPVREALEADGARLAAALDEVLRICAESQRRTPSAGFDIPAGSDVVHRALSQAATSAALAAESAAMARVAARAGDRRTAAARAVAASRAVDVAVARVAAAAAASNRAAETGGHDPAER